MKIKIYQKSLNVNNMIFMNDKKDFLLVNGKECAFDIDRFKFLVGNITSNWPNTLEDPSVVDGLEYTISINNKNNNNVYKFKNEFPEDIYRLTSLIDEVLEVSNVKNVR